MLTFALVDFVKSRFCSIHFTIILAGLKKIFRYTDRGLRYTEVRYIEVPLYKQKHTPTNSSKTKAEKKLIIISLEYPNPRNMLERPQNRQTPNKAFVHFFNPDKSTNIIWCQKPQLKLTSSRNKCQQPHTRHTLSKNTCR